MITKHQFDIAGKEYTHYRIQNRRGLEIGLLNYGATLTSVRVPISSSSGSKFVPAILEFPHLSDYLEEHPYIGATVGRYAGRIRGSFYFEKEKISLTTNEGENHLHGGREGFSRKVWQATPVQVEGSEGVTFHYQSPAGEEGYPGNLSTWVTVTLNDEDEISFSYRARSDRPTPVNLTNHAYWNLGEPSVLGLKLQINSSLVLETDELIPTGKIISFGNDNDNDLAFLDFRVGKTIETDLYHPQLQSTFGYDETYVFNSENLSKHPSHNLQDVAELVGESMAMRVATTCPGMQLYTGNHLSDPFKPYDGVCLETQYFPDSPHHPSFPSTWIYPDSEYRETTVYKLIF